jgi:hypothetical protein
MSVYSITPALCPIAHIAFSNQLTTNPYLDTDVINRSPNRVLSMTSPRLLYPPIKPLPRTLSPHTTVCPSHALEPPPNACTRQLPERTTIMVLKRRLRRLDIAQHNCFPHTQHCAHSIKISYARSLQPTTPIAHCTPTTISTRTYIKEPHPPNREYRHPTSNSRFSPHVQFPRFRYAGHPIHPSRHA